MTLPAFETVLDEHGAPVLRLLSRLLGRADAEDVWQETFIAALGAYAGLRPDSDVRAWLYTIAHRKAIDRFRWRARQPVPSADAGDELAASDPSGAVVAHLDGVELWARVRHLPAKQRIAVGFRFGTDMSYADLAAVIGCSPAAARRSVFEGLRTLRSQLGALELQTEEVPS